MKQNTIFNINSDLLVKEAVADEIAFLPLLILRLAAKQHVENTSKFTPELVFAKLEHVRPGFCTADDVEIILKMLTLLGFLSNYAHVRFGITRMGWDFLYKREHRR